MTIFCANCGTENNDIDKLCADCGFTLQETLESQNAKYNYQSDTVPYAQGDEYGSVPVFTDQIPMRNYWNYFLVSISPLIFLVGSILWLLARDANESSYEIAIYITIVLSIIGGGVMIIYVYHNFNDYRNMINKYHPGTHPLPYPPLYMVVILFIFEPVTIYFKYSQFFEHITKTHSQKENLPPSEKLVFLAIFGPLILIPFLIFGGIIFPGIWLTWPLVSILSTFIMIAFENRWQILFNQHVQFHEANY